MGKAIYGYCENKGRHKLDTVKVSPTQPTTKEKVWLQKGKNLVKSFRAGYGYNTTIGQYEEASMFSSTEPIDVEAGQTYIFSNSIGHMGGCIHCLDANNNFIETLNQDGVGRPFTITAPNCKKVVVVAWDPASNASVNETWMQLEQGEVATEYEAYIEPKIYVKNDNDVYENFNVVVKDDFAVITGSMTLDNGEGSIVINYPEGFTADNCVVIGVGIDHSSSSAVLGFGATSTKTSGAQLYASNIKIISTANGETGPTGDVGYKIVLMKYE